MPRADRIILRTFSNTAIAMWPPSNGSSGIRLIAPSTKFSWARKNQTATHSPWSTVSPPMMLAPTTLIGVSGSRSPERGSADPDGTDRRGLVALAGEPLGLGDVDDGADRFAVALDDDRGRA